MAVQLFNVGVKAAIVENDKILIVKHATKDFWDIPGGRIDDNESIHQTLEREIAEELPNSRLLNIGRFICAYRVPDLILDNGGGLLLLVHEAVVEFPRKRMELSDEHSEMKWVTYEEASKIGSHIVKETIKSLQGEA